MAYQRTSVLLGKFSDSNLQLGLAVAASTVLFGLFGYVADSTMTRFKIPEDLHAGMVGAAVGTGAGFAFCLILAGMRERRRRLASEIERLAELNHTVRNSLEIIALATHASSEQHRALVLENTARIDQKLREMFPVVGIRDRRKQA